MVTPIREELSAKYPPKNQPARFSRDDSRHNSSTRWCRWPAGFCAGRPFACQSLGVKMPGNEQIRNRKAAGSMAQPLPLTPETTLPEVTSHMIPTPIGPTEEAQSHAPGGEADDVVALGRVDHGGVVDEARQLEGVVAQHGHDEQHCQAGGAGVGEDAERAQEQRSRHHGRGEPQLAGCASRRRSPRCRGRSDRWPRRTVRTPDRRPRPSLRGR